MSIKLLLAIICFIFCAVTSKEIRANRELSQDVRNKLIEVLNRDRQEIGKKLNITMQVVKYDSNLEKSIAWPEDDCMKLPSYMKGPTLSGDSLARKMIEKYTKGVEFFMPSHKTIGCSKDFKCSMKYDSTAIDKAIIGKTLVHRGICIFGEERKVSDEDRSKIENAELPTPFKYGDIIGVDEPSRQGSGSGGFLSLTMSLFLVFHI